jgi:hypothetical protein
VQQASALYGISRELCEEYSAIFKKDFKLLRKGCSFTNTITKNFVIKPIRLVYTGNLYYGREKILKIIADQLEKINAGVVKIMLQIYTPADITPRLDIMLNRTESSHVMGFLSYEDVKKVLADADIVLHVESFESKQANSVRLSFSTKITDCMQSGSCIMAIGPDNISSINFLKNIGSAIVVTDLADLHYTLNDLVNNPDQIIVKAKQLNEYAIKNHNMDTTRNDLKNDFKMLK